MNEAFKEHESFWDLLKQLVRQPSVVGAEHPFFATLKRELDELGVETVLYEGVLVAKGDNPHSGALSAHIDRHGLICTGPNEFQFAAFLTKNRADLTGDSVSEQMYTTIIERYFKQSVQAYEPWSGSYLGQGIIDNAYICKQRKNLVFELKGLEHLVAGTPVAFVDSLKSDSHYVSAQLDNVLSAAIIIYLYRCGYQGTAFFTAQEEAGRSWRFILEWYERYDQSNEQLLVLDTSPFNTKEEANAQDIVLRHRDANAVFNSPLQAQIEQMCKTLGISYSYKDAFIQARNEALIKEHKTPVSLGSTEMGRIIASSRGRIQGTTLQIPTTGYHTTNESASIASIAQMLRLLKHLLIKS